MAPTVWDYVFVTPDAYIRIFDLPYQTHNFNAYHRRASTRLLHSVFSVTAVFGWFLLFSYFNAGFVLLSLLALWYLRIDLRTGLFALPVMILMWMGAGYVHTLTGSATFNWSLAVIIGSSFLQSLSHAVEDVPPPLSRRGDQWAPVKEWVKETSIFIKLLLLVWGTFLEVITGPRLFPVVVSVYLAKSKPAPHSRPAS